MAFGDRFRRAINNIGDRLRDWIDRDDFVPPDEPQPPDDEEPPDEPPPEPPEEPPEPPEDGLIELYDYFGNYIGTNTWDGWWNATLQRGGAYGRHTYELILALERTLDIEWPWAQWAAAYKAAKGM